jgi:hypothetical protein
LTFIAAVQLADDCADFVSDSQSGQRNFACRFGLTECALLALSAFLLAWSLDARLFVPVFTGSVAVYAIMLYFQRRGGRCF